MCFLKWNPLWFSATQAHLLLYILHIFALTSRGRVKVYNVYVMSSGKNRKVIINISFLTDISVQSDKQSLTAINQHHRLLPALQCKNMTQCQYRKDSC